MSEDKGYLKFLINEPIYLTGEEVIESTDAVATQEEATPEVKKTEHESSQKPHQEIVKPVNAVAEPDPPKIEEKSTEPVVEVAIPSKELLVVYKFEESEPLPIHLKKLMLKIIGAVGIDVMKGVYVNLSFKELPSKLNDFESILVFSSTTKLELEGYQQTLQYDIQTFGNTRVLVSDELDLLDQQVPMKRKLWGVLQKMFPKD